VASDDRPIDEIAQGRPIDERRGLDERARDARARDVVDDGAIDWLDRRVVNDGHTKAAARRTRHCDVGQQWWSAQPTQRERREV
jgi:hypothetical protein